MLKIKNYVKAESLEQAYELNQKRTACVLGGMVWLKMGNRNIMTAIDLSGLGLDVFKRCRNGHAGRASDQQTFFRSQTAGHFECFGIVDLHDFVGKFTVERFRIEILAHAFDAVLMHVVRIGIDGSFRVGADHLYCAVGSFLQIAPGAGNGAASADARHEIA